MSLPVLERTLDGYRLTWADQPVIIDMQRLCESKERLTAEATIQYVNGAGPVILRQQTWNLLAGRTQGSLARELLARIPVVPWDSILEQACTLTIQTFRIGEPIVSMEPGDDDEPAQFLLNPLLLVKNPTILYGPGGSMKSYFAHFCSMLLASGQSFAPLYHAPEARKVLYLDYEMSIEDLRGRSKWIRRGHPELTACADYRRCWRPLASESNELRKVVQGEGYEVVIVDSLALAAGGVELEKAEAAQRLNAALRELDTTPLLIGHTPKDREGVPEARAVFGSVFFTWLARSTWEVRKDQDVMGFYNRKFNGPEMPPFGLRQVIDSADRSCRWEPAALEDEPELQKGLPLKQQIKAHLKAGSKRTKDLIEVVEAKPDTIRRTLQRYKGRLWDHAGDDGDKTTWTLILLT